MDSSTSWLSAAEAAARLGVKTATLYAYVSRGSIARRRDADGRSWFDAEHVRRLAARSRGRRGGHAEIAIPTAVSHVAPDGRVTYRGRDACALADGYAFEAVATFLWSGSTGAPAGWAAPREAIRAGRAAARALRRSAPDAALPAIAAAAGGAHPAGYDASAARGVLATLVDALPVVGPEPADDRLAARLFARLADRAPSNTAVRALDVALGCQADRGLVGSTLVARLCASRGADPFAVVAAAATVGGVAVREGAFDHVHRVLDRVAAGEAAAAVLEADPPSPPANPEPADPRADLILGHTTRAFGDTATTVAHTVAAWTHIGATVDASVALGAFTWSARMIGGAAQTIALVSRAAGWLAHALEEYREPTAFRTRDVYTGPPPEPGGRSPTLESVLRYLRG